MKKAIETLREIAQDERDEEIDNKLELMKYTTKVQSRIKSDINSDYVLCRLETKDKEAVTEMVSTAYFIKRILANQADKAKKYEYNNKTKEWTERKLNQAEKYEIKEQATIIFNAYITRVQMTVLLNRNIANNHLIKMISGYHEEEEKEQEEKEQTTMQKIMNKLRPEPKEET